MWHTYICTRVDLCIYMHRLYVDQCMRVSIDWSARASSGSCFLVLESVDLGPCALWSCFSGTEDKVSWPVCWEACGCKRLKWICHMFVNYVCLWLCLLCLDGLRSSDAFYMLLMRLQCVWCLLIMCEVLCGDVFVLFSKVVNGFVV